MQGSQSVQECIAEMRGGQRVWGCEGVRGFGDALDASWLGMEPEGLGLALGARE